MTKAEIIDAAFKVWGRNFYKKTSLSQLASELKVSKPALYRHFQSKNALNAAMIESFLDDFSSYVQNDFQKALQTEDTDEGISTIIRSISSFFAKNAYALIFSLMNIYDRNLDGRTFAQKLKSRGADMETLQIVIQKKYESGTTHIRLIFATLTFFMSHFHKTKKALETPLSLDDINKITSFICAKITHGLGYSGENSLIDFDILEKRIEASMPNYEPEPFFKAVAEAVAEAGPWNVSMDMVAKKLGMSKSSLYGHFKNKKDMLRRLFLTEFKRILEYSRQGISKSANSTEQLFLGIYSYAVYLRSRPEILVAMDWIRTRKLDLGKPDKNMEIFRLFEDVNIENLQNASNDEKQLISHWILFLLLNILIHPFEQVSLEAVSSEKNEDISNEHNGSIRLLYKFIILGLGGFKR